MKAIIQISFILPFASQQLSLAEIFQAPPSEKPATSQQQP